MASRLVAPGVPREMIEEMTTESRQDQQSMGRGSGGRVNEALLTGVNAWAPPAAYGGLQERSGKGAKAGQSKTGKHSAGGGGPGQNVLVSADNFLQFTQLPFQPADAPQRVATGSKFRLDRKLRYSVGARTPPCVGVVGVGDTVGDNLRCVAMNGEGTSYCVSTDDGTFLWSATTPQSTSTMEPEHRLWNELFFGAQPQTQQTQLYQVPGASVVQISQQPPPTPLTGHNGLSTAGAVVWKPLNLRGVLGASFAPDAPLLLTTGIHGQVTLTATDSQMNLVSYSGHASRVPVWTVEWSPAGTYFATGAGDGCGRLWRTDIVAPLRTFTPAGDAGGRHVQTLAWHPNCQVVATASECEVTLWDVLASNPIQKFKRTNTNDLAFSPNGNLLAIASDQGLEVVDVAEAKTLMNDESEVAMNVAWSWPTVPPSPNDRPNGASCLVGVGQDGKCKLYDKIGQQNAAICELPLERNLRPFKAQFTWKNFLLVAGVDLSEKLTI